MSNKQQQYANKQQVFSYFFNKTRDLLEQTQSFNAKGRKVFAFAMLQHIGICDYKHLEDEFEKIQLRQSKLSSTQRAAVQGAMMLIEIEFTQTNKLAQQNENDKV